MRETCFQTFTSLRAADALRDLEVCAPASDLNEVHVHTALKGDGEHVGSASAIDAERLHQRGGSPTP